MYVLLIILSSLATLLAPVDRAADLPVGGGAPRHAAGSGIEASASALGLRACSPGETSAATPPVVAFISCSGEMRTFDGLEIDARLTFPTNASAPLPIVLLLHGWAGDRRWWQREPEPTDDLGRGRFLAEGFATLATTARGFWASCGAVDPVADVNSSGSTPVTENPSSCTRGWTHIAERSFEVRDSQTLLGQLVDAGIGNPGRLGIVGESYGGGQAWLLATSLPWTTEAGITLQPAAVVSLQGWTDLLEALAPSGRDGPSAAQREQVLGPVGVLKSSIFSTLWASGRLRPMVIPSYPIAPIEVIANYNTVDPSERHSFIDGWTAGFEAAELAQDAATDYFDGVFAGKSAIHATDYFAAVRAGSVDPTPVLALQGWTDHLFDAGQALRMYDLLKEVRADYPVRLALADGGHFAPPRPEHWRQLGELGARFLVEHLSEERNPGAIRVPNISSARATCNDIEPMFVTAERWDAMTGGSRVLVGKGSQAVTVGSPLTEAPLDPLVAGRFCLEAAADPAAARWSWELPPTGLETIGLQRIVVAHELEGPDATLVARLWERATDGTRRLVTSGVYRVTKTHDGQSGTLDFALFGTHWRFAPESRIEVEFSQTDAPFLRPNRNPAALVLTSPRLVLPLTADSGTSGAPRAGAASDSGPNGGHP